MNKLLYLGPVGTFSYLVAEECRDKLNNIEIEARDSFFSIHRDILNNENCIGILPFENSITSNIYENVEFIFDNDVKIIGEFLLPIELNLIGKKISSVEKAKYIISHPKALKQCSRFIKENNLQVREVSSTAQAQNDILKLDDEYLAIGNNISNNSLHIVRKNIGNYNNNKTRFLLITTGDFKIKESENKKISFLFKLKHEKGSLSKMLHNIANEDINMMKIESKPIAGTNLEYMFLIEGTKNSSFDKEQFQQFLDKNTLENKILGIY